MKAYIKMILFLFVLSAISATILTGFNIETQERIEKNRKHERLIHAMKTLRLLPQKIEQQLENDNRLKALPEQTAKDKFDKAAARIELMEQYLKKQTMPELLPVFDARVKVLEIARNDPQQIHIYQGQEFIKSPESIILTIFISSKPASMATADTVSKSPALAFGTRYLALWR